MSHTLPRGVTLSAARVASIEEAISAALDRVTGRPAVGLVIAAIAWFVITSLSTHSGGLPATGGDARCYWGASLADPYLYSRWNDPIAYVYSPAFLQLISPLLALPWPAFVAAWAAIALAALRYLTGPRLLAAGILFPFTVAELYGGNIHLLLAAAIVAGFRWPAAWSLVLLTKVTPGIGLLWFALRHEWRRLAIALLATGAIAATSALLMPDAWRDWPEVLLANAGKGGTWAALPLPLWLRFPAAVALVAWGARADRPWTVPVAAMLALPALWYGGFSMLLAVIPFLGTRSRPLVAAGTAVARAAA